MRFDILPLALSQELSLLFENVKPMPFAQTQNVIETALQQPLDQLFASFEPQAIAAASVAQVHRATTHQGEIVAVKVQRHGIAAVFDSDMRIMTRFAKIVDRLNLLSGLISAVDTVSEFSSWTRSELDFRIEKRIAERLQIELGTLAKTPKIYQELSRQHVLTMEFIQGYTLAQVFTMLEQEGWEALKQKVPELDLPTFGRNLVKTVLHQLFISGIFHGDPHPGNLIVCQDNHVGLIDFGIFGELQAEQQAVLAQQINSIVCGDIDGCFRCFAKQYLPTDETDWHAFEEQAKSLLKKWYQASLDPHSSLKEQHLGNHSAELMECARQHKLRGGTNTLLFWRSLYVLDATALKLRDHLNLFQEMQTFFTEYRPALPNTLAELLSPNNHPDYLTSMSVLKQSITPLNPLTPDHHHHTNLVVNTPNTTPRLSRSFTLPVLLFISSYLLLTPQAIPGQTAIACVFGVLAGIESYQHRSTLFRILYK